MDVTVALDETLLKKAEEMSGVQEQGELLERALRALIRQEAYRRVADLGGTDPAAEAPPRRRSSI